MLKDQAAVKRQTNRMSLWRSAAVIALAVAAVVTAAPARAAVPLSLAGERFQGADFIFDFYGGAHPVDGSQPVGCNPKGTSTIEFTETGIATGAYPGTFKEHVVAKIGPQAPQGGLSQPGLLVGNILSFTAEFEIDSLVGKVRGKKTLAPAPVSYISNSGSCFSASAPDGSQFGYPYLENFTFTARSLNAFLRYEATIETIDGSYRDSGDAWARFDEGAFRGYCNDLTNAYCASIKKYDPTGEVHNGFYSQGGFQELFLKSRGVVPEKQEPSTLELTPAAATNEVGTEHCVVATVRDSAGAPVSNVTVEFNVSGSTTATARVATGTDGTAQFCYTGPGLPGEDVINAFADSDEDSEHDVGEPAGVATKSWVFPASTPDCDVSISNGGWIVAANGDKASFGGNAKVDALSNESGEQQYNDHGPAQPMKVHSIEVAAVVCSASRAEIYGIAEVDSVPGFAFRIRVQDTGEPGVSDTYGILVANGYDSGDQPLSGGNIQVRART